MTGAKLLGMHESVTSPKEYRSHHHCMVMPASCRGAMRTTLRGNPRQIPPLPGGRRVPWLCGRWLEGHFQGQQCYPPKAAAADLDACA